jgi:hypothetical protein
MSERGDGRPNYREIDKQLSRALRLDHRKDWQTEPDYTPPTRTPEEEAITEAENIVAKKQLDETIKKRDQSLAHFSAAELERYQIEVIIDDLKEIPTMSYKINRALDIRDKFLGKMQQHDPNFMNPILTGIKKRPERQAKAERAIKSRSIDPGVSEYGEYFPLWERS